MGTKKPKTSSKPKEQIVKSNVDIPKQFVISFRYLDINNRKYNMKLITDNGKRIQFENDFFKKINEYSQEENFKKYICENGRYRDKNHIHSIDWNDNKIHEKAFTNLDMSLFEQIKDDCWQLGINSTTFRIHGFFIDNVFYIVWLDPLHQLYKAK